MEMKKYTKEDGTEGESYKLTPGDKVQFKRVHKRQSKFGLQTAMITMCNKYVNLTGSQAKQLEDKNIQEGDMIESYAYKNDFGDQVGVNVISMANQSTLVDNNGQQPQKAVTDNWVEFAKGYKERMAGTKEGVANSMHLLGAYIANKHTEQFTDVITLCKKEFVKEEKPEPLKVEI